MKKIMFNERYGLTRAVLEGRKTMTRRMIKAPKKMEGKDVYGFAVAKRPGSDEWIEVMALDEDEGMINNILPKYKPGEVVAVAQRYWDVVETGGLPHSLVVKAGWTNKMFVRADLMPHRILITGVRLERLQDISDEDCYKEGIYKKTLCPPGDIDYYYHSAPRSKREVYPSPRDAFAGLIDKVSGEGTWASNPFVFVYEFELVK